MRSAQFHPHRNYLARAQDGLLHWNQLVGDLGIDPTTVSAWVRDRRLKRWYREVYSDATLPETWRRWLLAGLLALGPDAVVAGRAAAALWGLAGFDRLEVREFLVPRANAPRLSDAAVRGATELAEGEITTVGAIRTLTVTRTLQTLTRFGACPDDVSRAAADACRRGRTSEEEIARFLATHPNGRGNRPLRRALAMLDEQYARCRSVAEVDGHTFLQRFGFGGYVINDRVRLTNDRTVEFDVHFLGRWKVIEWDGERYHGSPVDRAYDLQRDADAGADGYAVLRVPVRDLADEVTLARRVAAFLRS